MWIYEEYVTDFEEDHLVFPDRIYSNVGAIDTSEYDIDWALDMPELAAWDRSYKFMGWTYGIGFMLWALNMTADNNGGNLHELFWRAS